MGLVPFRQFVVCEVRLCFIPRIVWREGGKGERGIDTLTCMCVKKNENFETARLREISTIEEDERWGVLFNAFYSLRPSTRTILLVPALVTRSVV